MSTTTRADPAGHPVVSFTARLHAVMDTLNEVPVWSMTDAEKRQVLVSLSRVQGRVEELRLRVLAEADRADVGAQSAATSTGAWLADATAVPVRVAHGDVRLARALDEVFAATREALAAGRVDVEQARVVVASVQGLPVAAVEADPSLAGRAEKHLLTLAEGTDSVTDTPPQGATETSTSDTDSDITDVTTDGVTDGASEGDSDRHYDPDGRGRHPGLDAVRLRQVGRHLFHVLDPDAADVELGRRLDAEERAAARRTFFSMFDNGDGTHSGRFKISDLHAAMIRKALEAITAPRQQHQTTDRPDAKPTADAHHEASGQAGDHASDQASGQAGDHSCDQAGDPPSDPAKGAPSDPAKGAPSDPAGDRVAKASASRPEMMGEAFCRLLERITAQHLPQAGGMSSTVVVLLDYDQLLSGLGTARLDTGEVISAGAARRMACESGIIPAVYRKVLGGRSVVLDVGRRRRFHTETQRIALTIQDGGCSAENCDRPPAWTETHHPVPWAAGGVTSVANGQLLCGYHHHKAHSPAYDLHRLPTGKVRFHKRT